MKKFVCAGSSLVAAAFAYSAGAVDVTLGGSIDMGVEYGLGKSNGDLTFAASINEVSLSIAAGHTTDGGLAFGGNFTVGTAAEIEFDPYVTGNGKRLVKATVTGQTNIANQLWNVSGGGAVDSGDVVSVKINSSWRGLEGTQTLYQVDLGEFASSNLCKIAGRGTKPTGGNFGIWGGDRPASTIAGMTELQDHLAESVAGSYLPAGQMLMWYVEKSVSPGAFIPTTDKTRVPVGAPVSTTRGVTAKMTASLKIEQSAWENTSTQSATHIDFASKGQVDFDGAGGSLAAITDALIYVGPFMEVQMASSETKMVVGAACLTGVKGSSTAYYMNNSSKVATVSNASIFIDGGFGRLTMQSSDYAGGVSAIAGAGDQADISADGLVVIAQGIGPLGANPYIALDLNALDSLGELEVITGGTITLGGLAASIDVALDNPTDAFGISDWDLGLSYAMGRLSLAAATDSSTDWGLRASMDLAEFAVSTTFGSSSADDHEKAGITYSVSASTNLNGYSLAIGFDQDLQPDIGISYNLSGLNLYANYDAGDEGGSIGATLSF